MEATVLIMTAPVNRVVSLSGCSQWIATRAGSRHGSSPRPLIRLPSAFVYMNAVLKKLLLRAERRNLRDRINAKMSTKAVLRTREALPPHSFSVEEMFFPIVSGLNTRRRQDFHPKMERENVPLHSLLAHGLSLSVREQIGPSDEKDGDQHHVEKEVHHAIAHDVSEAEFGNP